MKGKDYAKTVNNGLSFCQGMIYRSVNESLGVPLEKRGEQTETESIEVQC